MEAFTELLVERLSEGRPFSLTAVAMRLYLQTEGRLQVGSQILEKCDRVWLRPLKGGRWSIVMTA